MPRFFGLPYALRTLRSSPLFSAIVVLSLAVGIGGNAAIFSIVNAMLLHPPGIEHAGRVVAPRVTYKKLHLDAIDMSIPDFASVRDSREVFSSAAAATIAGFNYTSLDSPQRLRAALVTWQWFQVFGAVPATGRGFRAEEDQPGAGHVAVLSYELWNRLFGAQRSAVGATIELDRKPYRIVGVMPPSFRWPMQADLWVPAALAKSEYAEQNRFNEFYTVVARLRPGVSFAQCQSFMRRLTERVKAGNKQVGAYANDSQWSMLVEPFSDFASGSLKGPLLLLSGALGLVLLVVCSNIAGLMLVRGTGRARDLAIRTALGASSADLMMQCLSETAILASAGTLLGLAAAPPLLRLILSFAPEQMTSGYIIEPDHYVAWFTFGVGALTAFLCSLAPAYQASKGGSRYESLKSGGRSETAGRGRQRIRDTLVTAQIALAFLLVAAAGLLLKELNRMRSTDLGFSPGHVMTAAVELPDSADASAAKRAEFFRSVVTRLQSSPGVTAAAVAEPVPFNGDHWTASFEIEGRPNRPGDPGPHGYHGYVGPAYFEALKVPLLEGRFFTDADREGQQPVAIVDENLARQYWPDQSPVGKRMRNGGGNPWELIVGVVKHIRAYDFAAGDARGVYYVPAYQSPIPQMNFVVRTTGDPDQMTRVIGQAVAEANHSQAVYDFAPLTTRIAKALGPAQFAAGLLTVFAGAAGLLAAFGLYGVVSYSAGQRKKEMGIRAAIGASRWQLVLLVAGQGLVLVAIGIALGAAAGLPLSRVVPLGEERTGFNFAVVGYAAFWLLVVAILATAIPAWRAATADPLAALREE